MKLQPTKNKIVIRLVEPDKETTLDSGIILANPDKDEANLGLVLAVGPETSEVVVGQTILPNWNEAEKVDFEREYYFIIKETDVVGIVDR
jgi:co-chaperonin GroES (HSP10)